MKASPYIPPAEPNPTKQQYNALFPKEWTEEKVGKPSRDGSFIILRLLSWGYFLCLFFLFLGLAGSFPPIELLQIFFDSFRENTVLAVNTMMIVALMLVLALTGTYNPSLRWYCSLALFTGHGLFFAASAGLYFLELSQHARERFLVPILLAAAGMFLLYGWVMLQSRKSALKAHDPKEFPEFYSIANRLTKGFFLWLGRILALLAAGIIAMRIFGDNARGPACLFKHPDPFVAATLALFTMLSVLAFLLKDREALRERLHSAFTTTFITGVVVILAILVFHKTFMPSPEKPFVHTYLILEGLVLTAVAGAMLGIRKMYYNIEYGVSAVGPSTAQNILALHDALYGGSPEDHDAILQSIDRHVAGVRGRKRGLLNFPFWVIEHLAGLYIGVAPGFSSMSRDEQKYLLRRKILRPPDERNRSLIPPVAEQMYKVGNAVHALITIAHFSHIKGRQQIGYIPPDARDRLQGDYPAYPPPFKNIAGLPDSPQHPANFKPSTPALPRPLVAPRVVTPVIDPPVPDEVDYLIVGSGAGGAVMAYRLACRSGVDPSRILIVERGPRYSPLQDFNDDEMEMVRKLYKEGGLQQTKRFDLMVLQGECVGGTTVINNAICFQMPDRVKQSWQNDYGLDLSAIAQEYDRIAKEIEIGDVSEDGINQIVKEKFWKGVDGLNNNIVQGAEKLTKEALKANFRNIDGNGLCNIGNKRMRKRSMLETFIPWSEARGVRVVSEMSAVRFFAEKGKAAAVLLRTNIGHMKKVKVKKAVIVAGGVIASSNFLMRSGLQKNVGAGMSCNFAFPVAFDFPDELRAYDGVQITLGALDSQNRAIFETYFNPPGSFAISLPFYFDRLHGVMQRYPHLINFGTLVGSEPNGTVELKADLLNGRAFTWNLGEQDKDHIKYALSTLVDIGKYAGAERAIIPTEPGMEIPLTDGDVQRFKKNLAAYPLRMKDLRLTTAHPQGGNRMIGKNSINAEARVVNADFRVDGLDNVFVADASLFPTGITVNPQWTIMALSSMASQNVP